MMTRGGQCFRKAERREPSANDRLRMVGNWNGCLDITGTLIQTALVVWQKKQAQAQEERQRQHQRHRGEVGHLQESQWEGLKQQTWC